MMSGATDRSSVAGSFVDSESNQERRRKKKKTKGCLGYILKFDESCMKPIFIHKYTKEKEAEADHFAKDFTEDGGQKVESEYGRSITTQGVRRRKKNRGSVD